MPIAQPPGAGAGAGTTPPPPQPPGTDGGAADAGTDAALPAVDAAIGGELTVVSVEPAARTVTAAHDSAIVVHFDRPVNRASVTTDSFWAFGRWSGPVDGSLSFSEADRAVTLTPARGFTAGDRVTVILSHDLRGADGSSLRSAGYSFQFITSTATASAMFTEIDRMTTRTTASVTTRSYGGTAVDLDGDSYLDLLIVNEDSGDLRIFMNKGDGTGAFHPFLEPPTPLDDRASPSEATDFNRDGNADLVTANLDAANVSILLGNGDATFEATQKIDVGLEPRGLAVLDVDGDGDVDVVNSNRNTSNLSVLINDGTGSFGAPGNTSCADAPGSSCYFDAGSATRKVDQEFGLSTGDMDEDGILDLVVGDRMTGGTVVDRGNGDGTFSFLSASGPDTDPWQLFVADLNGDGHEDVGTANADANTAALLAGDGAGSLALLDSVPAIAYPFAIDGGDLDGDGDVDVVVSNFGGQWQIFENDGAGALTLNDTVPPSNSASCALLLDFDNDRDLDLVLIDEVADELILLEN